MKKSITIFLLITTLILLASIVLPETIHAQAPPPPPAKPEQNPIDGGLALLAVAGGTYAIKKLKARKQ